MHLGEIDGSRQQADCPSRVGPRGFVSERQIQGVGSFPIQLQPGAGSGDEQSST